MPSYLRAKGGDGGVSGGRSARWRGARRAGGAGGAPDEVGRVPFGELHEVTVGVDEGGDDAAVPDPIGAVLRPAVRPGAELHGRALSSLVVAAAAAAAAAAAEGREHLLARVEEERGRHPRDALAHGG